MVPMIPRFVRRAQPLLAALAVLVLAGCSSARPELPKSPQARATMRDQGAALIDSCVTAHGGMDAWNKVVEMTFRGEDVWSGPVQRTLNPWPVERATGQNSFRVHDGVGRIAIVTDDGTLTYGVGKAGPWALLAGQPSPRKKDEGTASYIVPWTSFLAGVPWRFKESGAVAHYLGRAYRKYHNSAHEYDEVLVTYPPEGDLWPDDWFVVRLDPVTHELRTMTYTTSNRSPKWMETTCEFSDFTTLEGLKIATRRTCSLTSPMEREAHVWTLSDIRFNQLSPDSYFERATAGQPLPVSTGDSTGAVMGDSLAAKAGAATAKPDPAKAASH